MLSLFKRMANLHLILCFQELHLTVIYKTQDKTYVTPFLILLILARNLNQDSIRAISFNKTRLKKASILSLHKVNEIKIIKLSRGHSQGGHSKQKCALRFRPIKKSRIGHLTVKRTQAFLSHFKIQDYQSKLHPTLYCLPSQAVIRTLVSINNKKLTMPLCRQLINRLT